MIAQLNTLLAKHDSGSNGRTREPEDQKTSQRDEPTASATGAHASLKALHAIGAEAGSESNRHRRSTTITAAAIAWISMSCECNDRSHGCDAFVCDRNSNWSPIAEFAEPRQTFTANNDVCS